jgi:glycine dehydrogenase subunit 2
MIPTKVRSHLTQNEDLIFEQSSPGKIGYQLPSLDVPEVDPVAALGAANVRAGIEDFPEVSEVEVIRHFTRLSTWNYAIDLGMYPLGSCTMKYNPRINEAVARIEGLAWAHPYQPESLSQGVMEVTARLEDALLEITGLDAITLQPAAGAHGELTGILLVRAFLEAQGNPRQRILTPDSAHGTNPATAGIAGYAVQNIPSNDQGMIDLEVLARAVDSDVAALMVTNPNTLGVFEENIMKAADILHAKGAMVYMDGANMNALVGIARPGDFGIDVMHLNLHKTFSTPHGGGGPGGGPVAVRKHLEPFLPVPRLKRLSDSHLGLRPASIHRQSPRVLWQLRRAGSRAGLYLRAWRPGSAQRHGGCRAERKLSSASSAPVLRFAVRSSQHARGCLQRRPAGG